MVLAVLSAQNTQEKIEEERDRITLQLAMVTDRKISQAIEILDRIDSTFVKTAERGEIDAMKTPTDVHQVAGLLRDIGEEADEPV